MEPWLRLHSEELTVYIRIENYLVAKKNGDYVTVNLRINGDGVNYERCLSDFEYFDIDDLRSCLWELLVHPSYNESLYTSTGYMYFDLYRDEDENETYLKVRYTIGIGGKNCFAIYFDQDNIEKLAWYLKLITRRVSEQEPHIKDYYADGTFQG